MNTVQRNFILSIPFIAKGTKSHRQCWFMPAWMRDGYRSEAHCFNDRAEPGLKFAAFNDADHPCHDLAVAASKLKL